MAQIIIDVEDESDIHDALIEVARLVDEGYTNGLIGVSSDSFEIIKD